MKTANQRNRAARRKRAQLWLDVLYARHNSLCFWCKSPLALVGSVPEQDRISVKGGTLVWRDGEEIFSALVATSDHLIPVRDGGNSDISNLVLSCMRCNGRRTAQPRMVINRVCPECLTEVMPRHRKCCTPCWYKRADRWLLDAGWEKVISAEPNHARWRDPVTGEVHIKRVASKIQGRRYEESKFKARTPAAD